MKLRSGRSMREVEAALATQEVNKPLPPKPFRSCLFLFVHAVVVTAGCAMFYFLKSRTASTALHTTVFHLRTELLTRAADDRNAQCGTTGE